MYDALVLSGVFFLLFDGLSGHSYLYIFNVLVFFSFTLLD